MLSAARLPQVRAEACISLQASWEQVNSSNCLNHVLRTKSSIKKRITVRRTVRSMFGEQTFAQLRTGVTLTSRQMCLFTKDEGQSEAPSATLTVGRVCLFTKDERQECMHVSPPARSQFAHCQLTRVVHDIAHIQGIKCPEPIDSFWCHSLAKMSRKLDLCVRALSFSLSLFPVDVQLHCPPAEDRDISRVVSIMLEGNHHMVLHVSSSAMDSACLPVSLYYYFTSRNIHYITPIKRHCHASILPSTVQENNSSTAPRPPLFF